MEKTRIKSRSRRVGVDPESLLESYYPQLLKWGAVLTRGDEGMAQDIVHDLCLHFTFAKPDLSAVVNLDGYLYTCLRNIYLSAITRFSREATQFVSVAEFDSIHFALSTSSSEGLLQRQNDLRRICSYTVWRKQSSKSASYLILLFFHGYCRREVAEIACLPIAAIYNKLKIAREEVKSYLEDSGKLRIATRELPPEPDLRLSPVSSVELFSEFRQMILQASSAECMPAETLINLYLSGNAKPISCSLLSHIVSCARCLILIDRHFQRPTLEDREPPEDFGSRIEQKSTNASTLDKSYRTMMRSVHKQKQRVYEHRPKTISIAVNGKISAFHDVQGERSALSSRIEYPEGAQFVEVFTEQRVRLALLPIGERPPQGSSVCTQRVALSDDRWLELTITFDGLGLQSEVTYFDPALAVAMAEDEVDEGLDILAQPNTELPANVGLSAKPPSVMAGLMEYLRGMMLPLPVAWAVVLVCISVTGFLAYRYYRAPLNASDVLNRSVRIETADFQGQAAHQMLRLEEAATDGHVLSTATIDVWKEGGTGRYMRRLYNDQHRLIAAEWRAKDGLVGSYQALGDDRSSEEDRALAASAAWRQDLSARSFRNLADSQVQIRALGDNYELTITSARGSQIHLTSATLVLDHMLRPIREILRVRDDSTAHELRLVQTDFERRPASSVPDSVFDPTDLQPNAAGDIGREPRLLGPRNEGIIADVPLVETQIAALFQLSKLGADAGEPIEVTRTRDRRISVSGTVADDSRRQQISLALASLPDHQLLEIRLMSQHDLRMPVPGLRSKSPALTSVYDFAQTDPPAVAVLRKHFGEKGWAGERIDSAVAQFSQDALGHTQLALQHAYALNRLGSAFTPVELESVDPASERQWAEMAVRHASALETELRGLDEQLTQIAPAGGNLNQGNVDQLDAGHIRINNPGDFARAASQLLRQTQNLNRCVGDFFASVPAGKAAQGPHALAVDAMHLIPLRSATDLAAFASRLADSQKTTNSLEQPTSRP